MVWEFLCSWIWFIVMLPQMNRMALEILMEQASSISTQGKKEIILLGTASYLIMVADTHNNII